MSNRTDARLVVDKVSVRFGGIAALTDVGMALSQGEIFGLIGPNGAGKTTLVNVLSGFQVPTQGGVTLDGHAVGARGPHHAARMGIGRTFQAGRLFRDLSVQENLMVAAMGSGLRNRDARRRAGRILAWMDCSDMAGQRCDSLSYGWERQIGIARALALAPKFVLLDEPASGMNDAESAALVRLITAIPGEFGCGVLLIEHNMDVVMGACQRVHVLDGGRSLAEGAPADIMRNPDVRRAYLGDKARAGNDMAKVA